MSETSETKARFIIALSDFQYRTRFRTKRKRSIKFTLTWALITENLVIGDTMRGNFAYVLPNGNIGWSPHYIPISSGVGYSMTNMHILTADFYNLVLAKLLRSEHIKYLTESPETIDVFRQPEVRNLPRVESSTIVIEGQKALVDGELGEFIQNETASQDGPIRIVSPSGGVEDL